MIAAQAQPRRVAILKPCCIGDCIMAFPAIDAIVARWPTASIDVFVGSHSRVAFAFRPSLNLRAIPDGLNLSSALQLSRLLRQGSYDAVVNLDRSRWLRLAARLSRATVSAGVRNVSPELRHESEVYLDVVRDIGLPTPDSIPRITPEPHADRRAAELLGGITWPVAVLQPGGAENPGARMLDKRWPAKRYIELARALKADGMSVLLSGGPDDRDIARQIAIEASIDESAVLAGRIDLTTLAAVLSRASVYVGPDTGVSHIAAAIGVPTIVIFGPTNPRRYRPLGQQVRVLAPAESWRIADRDLRQTPISTATVSTESVSLEVVLDAAREAVELAHGMPRCDR